MKQTLKKYYFIQLVVCFVLCVLITSTLGFVNNMDKRSITQLLEIAIILSILFALINGLTNSLNFTFLKQHSKFISFYLPMLIWFLPFTFVASEMLENREIITTNWLLILLYGEPILYNIILLHKIDKKKQHNSRLE